MRDHHLEHDDHDHVDDLEHDDNCADLVDDLFAWHDHYQRRVFHVHDSTTHQHHPDLSIDFYDPAVIHVARPDNDGAG